MATVVYNTKNISLIDGNLLEIKPLKIKYLRELMEVFNNIDKKLTEDEIIDRLCDCARIAMKQFLPEISNSIEEIQDNFDIKTIYEILDISAGIKMGISEDEKNIKKKVDESESGWDTLDLAKLESEVFLLGIWKDYEELELSLSMPELMSTLSAKRETDYEEKKFLAAIQGVDIEKGNKENAWEELKARVFSGGRSADPNDILSFQGVNAQKTGFGIGLGLDYEDLTKK